MNIILCDTSFDLKINVGHCNLYFMVQWFCIISWRLPDIWTPYFGIMSQYDPMFDLNIKIGHCNLYFMVQWFCLISWKLFSGWTSYFGTSQYDPTSDLKTFILCTEALLMLTFPLLFDYDYVTVHLNMSSSYKQASVSPYLLYTIYLLKDLAMKDVVVFNWLSWLWDVRNLTFTWFEFHFQILFSNFKFLEVLL